MERLWRFDGKFSPIIFLRSHSNFVARVSTSLLLLLLLLFLLPQHKSNETSWKMIRRFCHVFNGCNFIAICNIIIMYYDLWLFSVLREDFFFATFTIQHWTRTTIMTQQLTTRVLPRILDSKLLLTIIIIIIISLSHLQERAPSTKQTKTKRDKNQNNYNTNIQLFPQFHNSLLPVGLLPLDACRVKSSS